MNSQIINPEFPDLYKFLLIKNGSTVMNLVKAGTSELSDSDFIETDFKYFQDKLEFGSPDLLSELENGDKERINEEGLSGIEKYLVTLFPTLSRDTSDSGMDTIKYFSSLTKIGGDEIFCFLIPEKVNQVRAFDSEGNEAFRIEFEGNEIRDSKVVWILTSYSPGSPRKLNLSYEAYKGDKNPIRRMSDYVLRNDSLTKNQEGYVEIDGYLYSNISGSLIGTSKVEKRPIYDMMCGMVGNGWNRAKRYSIGDTVIVGDTVFESVEMENIGNHPYYSRMWIKKNDNK